MAQIDNHLAARRRHTHSDGEEMSHAELLAHMIKYHGWTLGMIHKRGNTDEGAYVRHWHDREHLPGQWPGNEPIAKEF